VVVDEAGMVGTRTLARLLAHAEQAGAKVVLVGDPHQLPEIDAGGILRGLANRLDTVQLTDNRRQREQWEREALDELRDGDVAQAVAAYGDHGRIVTADTAEALRERLVDDWWTARQARPHETGVMIAARRSDVDDLNTRARRCLAAAGQLTGPALSAEGRTFQAGDEVLFVRNDRRLGVVNGRRGVVRTVSDDHLQVETQTRVVTVPGGYLDDGHLHHGYATTAHKAQGATVDRAWVLGSDVMYREWGYVAMSRGRHHNALYVLESDARDDAATVVGLSRLSGQRLAVDMGAPPSDVLESGPAPPPAPHQRRLEQLRS
jgi:ATP-dependent exoDNAse (exonuclease V) alpha subunit